ncbi:MAG: hypothetical protein J6S60_10280 [Oscillospiraceae bacterium]|nr:hypothetical protein [Oscillospiraceae bacterium]
MANITFEQLVGLMAVALVLIGAYNTIMSAIKTHREEKKRKDAPVNTLEETVKKHDERLSRDHERLNELEDSNRIIMRALMALMSHEINGNSDDKLKASYDEIQRFLIEK